MLENHNWLTAVLADLAAYAEKNNLTELRSKIEETREVAVREIAQRAVDRQTSGFLHK